ncbi:uncharacterized protein LOC114278559 [Camellia sinensis]|uniref:uncharacterized protein LOC114278559 n=1 Tax=Camellia sinensis TaxID=4442 RepID=UPI001036C24A|nr:uncharacterized protein LOC114278559 [Camellia sinensis]
MANSPSLEIDGQAASWASPGSHCRRHHFVLLQQAFHQFMLQLHSFYPSLSVLNMEGCPGSTACLDSLAVAAIPALLYFNLSRCNLSDDECEKFSGRLQVNFTLYPSGWLQNLKVLNLGFNDISDACLVHKRGLMNLESLNLDSCRIDDEGLVNLTGFCHTKEWNGTCKLKNLGSVWFTEIKEGNHI